jgi:hypothetical protein
LFSWLWQRRGYCQKRNRIEWLLLEGKREAACDGLRFGWGEVVPSGASLQIGSLEQERLLRNGLLIERCGLYLPVPKAFERLYL